MDSRKAATFKPGDAEPQTKRRKLGKQNSKAESLIDSLNNDCLVYILSNLPVDDLNSITM
jgi:hypothetical protein